MAKATGAIVYRKGVLNIWDYASDREIAAIPVDEATMDRGDPIAAVSDALHEFQKPFESIVVDFILPQCFYGVDYITIPVIKKSQMNEAFRTELRSMYKNYNDLVFVTSELGGSRTNQTYCVYMAQKPVLTELKSVLAKSGISVDRFLPYGSVLLSGAIRLLPAARKTPFLLLHLEQEFGYIAAFGRDLMIGGMEIPFGVEALSDNRVVSERMLYHPAGADLLVINARERAKSTKLTMAINIEEEKIDEAVKEEGEEVAPNPELPDLTKVGTEQATSEADEKDEFDDEEEQKPEQVAVKTLSRSAVRVLPKFMRREIPETPEGFIMENFRLFERRVLTQAREMGLSDFLPHPDAILLDMPAEYSFIAAKMQAENRAFRWVNVADSGKAPASLLRYGAAGFSSGKLPVFTV